MSKISETETKVISENASFMFLDNKYQLTKVAANVFSAPTVSLTADEIDISEEQVTELQHCEEADFENRPITVFRFEGKHLVIFGSKRCREAVESGSGTIKAKLLTKHVLKRCLYDENAKATAQFLQQQIRESLNPPVRSRFDNNQNYRQRDNRQDFHRDRNDSADSSRPFKRGF